MLWLIALARAWGALEIGGLGGCDGESPVEAGSGSSVLGCSLGTQVSSFNQHYVGAFARGSLWLGMILKLAVHDPDHTPNFAGYG